MVTKSACIGPAKPHEEDRHAGGERGGEDPGRKETITEKLDQSTNLNRLANSALGKIEQIRG
jgi:hypothetical protein